MRATAEQCRHSIRGPKRKGNIYIYDARQCRRMTTDPSGMCPHHRKGA